MFEELQAARRTLEALSQGSSPPRSWSGTIAHQVSICVIVLWHVHQVPFSLRKSRKGVKTDIRSLLDIPMPSMGLCWVAPKSQSLIFSSLSLCCNETLRITSCRSRKSLCSQSIRTMSTRKNILGVWRNGCIRSIEAEERGASRKRQEDFLLAKPFPSAEWRLLASLCR